MRYTFIKQHDATDCAAACMGMVCLHYRKETTITKLRDLMGTDLKRNKSHRSVKMCRAAWL